MEDISGHFKEIYRNLYDRVTSDKTRKAALLLKPGKGDSAFCFSSDCLQINSDILLEYISKMLKFSFHLRKMSPAKLSMG